MGRDDIARAGGLERQDRPAASPGAEKSALPGNPAPGLPRTPCWQSVDKRGEAGVRRALRVGVPGGIAAGAVMALWSMGAMWVIGSGFWTPLNLIAHTFYRSAPLDGMFSAPAVAIGLAVHMTVASAFGVTIAVLAQWLPRTRSLVIAGGVLFVAVVWPVMQWGVWYKLDETAAEGFSEWIFALAHLLFGLVAAGLAMIGIENDETAMRARHAIGHTPPPRDPAPGSLFRPERPR